MRKLLRTRTYPAYAGKYKEGKIRGKHGLRREKNKGGQGEERTGARGDIRENGGNNKWGREEKRVQWRTGIAGRREESTVNKIKKQDHKSRGKVKDQARAGADEVQL